MLKSILKLLVKKLNLWHQKATLMNLWKKLDIYLLKVSNAIGSNISTEIIRTIKLITIKILSVDNNIGIV